MLRNNLTKINDYITKEHKVLDVGGGRNTFYRANYVIDILPFDVQWPFHGGTKKFFSKDTWITYDICKGNWPFKDKEFDFVICSHVLEDVRDPLKVCEEIIRVGKRGYIETPSRLAEPTRGVARSYIAGHTHHRWLVEIHGNTVVFTMKQHKIHNRRYSFKLGFNRKIRDEFSAVCLFWENSFDFIENYLQDYGTFLREFKEKETLKGKTIGKHTVCGGLRKLLSSFNVKQELPTNILDRSDENKHQTTCCRPR